MKRDVRIERTYPFPPDRVWRALTEPATLGRWFMENDLRPELGHAFTFRMKPQRGWDGITHCEVIELEPLRRIAFTYRGEATGEKALRCAGVGDERALAAGKGVFTALDTVLRFTLAAEGDGTRLVMEHQGFVGFKQVIVSFIMGAGWKHSVLPRLGPVLEAMGR